MGHSYVWSFYADSILFGCTSLRYLLECDQISFPLQDLKTSKPGFLTDYVVPQIPKASPSALFGKRILVFLKQANFCWMGKSSWHHRCGNELQSQCKKYFSGVLVCSSANLRLLMSVDGMDLTNWVQEDHVKVWIPPSQEKFLGWWGPAQVLRFP